MYCFAASLFQDSIERVRPCERLQPLKSLRSIQTVLTGLRQDRDRRASPSNSDWRQKITLLDTTTDWELKLNANDLTNRILLSCVAQQLPATPNNTKRHSKVMGQLRRWIGGGGASHGVAHIMIRIRLGRVRVHSSRGRFLHEPLPVPRRADRRYSRHPGDHGPARNYKSSVQRLVLLRKAGPRVSIKDGTRRFGTLDPSNDPIGKKDISTEVDLPVVLERIQGTECFTSTLALTHV